MTDLSPDLDAAFYDEAFGSADDNPPPEPEDTPAGAQPDERPALTGAALASHLERLCLDEADRAFGYSPLEDQ